MAVLQFVPIKKPASYRELSEEELTYDGGKMPWWGWVIIGAVATGAVVAGGIGVAKFLRGRGAPGEIEMVTIKEPEMPQGPERFLSEGYTMVGNVGEVSCKQFYDYAARGDFFGFRGQWWFKPY